MHDKKIDFSYEMYNGLSSFKPNPYKDPLLVKRKLKSEDSSLTDQDVDILTDFVIRGLSVVEQTDEQYQNRINEFKKSPTNCCPWTEIQRKGKWTAFIDTGKAWSESEGACFQRQC